MLEWHVTLFSYVVLRDYGFAPNPFGQICTLATCKPEIRRAATIGDWIVGTGSVARKRGDHLVYAMNVSEVLTFEEYWNEPRFQSKKPDLSGSNKSAFGDNIYHRSAKGDWSQQNSHHSLSSGAPNPANIERDTKADCVLIAAEYAYWGGSGPKIPSKFRNFDGHDICKKGPGHKRYFPEKMVAEFVIWLKQLKLDGYLGRPMDWPKPE